MFLLPREKLTLFFIAASYFQCGATHRFFPSTITLSAAGLRCLRTHLLQETAKAPSQMWYFYYCLSPNSYTDSHVLPENNVVHRSICICGGNAFPIYVACRSRPCGYILIPAIRLISVTNSSKLHDGTGASENAGQTSLPALPLLPDNVVDEMSRLRVGTG